MSFVSAFRGLGLLAAVLVVLPGARAQSLGDAFWTDVSAASISATGPQSRVPAAYRTLALNQTAMAARLAQAPLESAGYARAVEVPVPTPDGGTLWFRVVESSVMAPALQARYPRIRTYVGQGRDVASATVRISLTPAGFAAMAMTPDGVVYVDPYAAGNTASYVAYLGQDIEISDADRAALAAERVEDGPAAEARTAAPTTTNGANLRTYRLALSATGEYTAFHGGTVEGALAAEVTAMNRVNQVYEKDLSIRMELVANNDTLIFTDAATDPFNNDDTGTLISQNQTVITARIGAANYDIGHNFSTAAGGLAGLGVVCRSTQKSRGVTGVSQPVGDGFYIDYVAHEMGHQFSGNHSFNGTASNCGGGNRSASTAYEPGSGSTIMAYAGICGSTNNLQANSDAYFHAISLQEIVAFITTGAGSTCGVVTPTDNDAPVVSATGGYVLPVRTPFALTGSATDATPAALTYTWEEFDLGAGGNPAVNGVPTATGVPFFRSFAPTASPVRYFPQLTRQLLNQNPVRGEGLPIDARTLNFRLTARDNRAGGGAIDDTTVTVTTDAGAGPFAVTAPNTAGVVLDGGSTLTVMWDVANTDVLDDAGAADADGVDIAEVQILYSTDGGTTFTVLTAATPNDGSEDVVVPAVITSQGRLMIRAVGSVFYDVNNANFAVGAVANEDQARDATGLSAVAPNPATGQASFTLRSSSTEAVTVAVFDALGRQVALLHDGPVGVEQAFTVDVSRLPAGVYVVRATGGSARSTQRFTVVR